MESEIKDKLVNSSFTKYNPSVSVTNSSIKFNNSRNVRPMAEAVKFTLD